MDFIFHEIEFDAKIKRENHVVQLFMQNTITFEEMRQLLGKDITVDESRLYGNMFSAATSTSADSEGAANQGNNKDQPENQHGKQTSPGKPKTSETKIRVFQFQKTQN